MKWALLASLMYLQVSHMTAEEISTNSEIREITGEIDIKNFEDLEENIESSGEDGSGIEVQNETSDQKGFVESENKNKKPKSLIRKGRKGKQGKLSKKKVKKQKQKARNGKKGPGKTIKGKRGPKPKRGKNKKSKKGKNKKTKKGQNKKPKHLIPTTVATELEPFITSTSPTTREKNIYAEDGTCTVSCINFGDFQGYTEERTRLLSNQVTKLIAQNKMLSKSLLTEKQTVQQMKAKYSGLSRKLDEVFKRVLDLESQRIDAQEQTSGWQAWSKWSPCSVTCQSGTKFRTRECGGSQNSLCKGKKREVKNCYTKLKCMNVTLSCDVQHNNKCFAFNDLKKKSPREAHALFCQVANGHLANIYSEKHLKALTSYAKKKNIVGEYHWLGMTYNEKSKQVFNSDGSIAKYVRWMHEFGAGTKKSRTGIVLYFDPHEEFRKKNGFHVLNGIKNTHPSEPFQRSICEFEKI